MNNDISPEELSFRESVREFTLENLPQSVRNKVLYGTKLEKHEYIDWQKRLHDKGWIAPSWPKALGGTGWSISQRRVFHHELALCCAPETIPFGITMVGPVIYTFGNDEQKARFLPDILASNTWWCQGFSEPNSGSDLASLKTRAEDQGDHYLVNGQKTWTTHGMHADMMFCLARTNREVKNQEGISFLLLDMNSPGVERRPIQTIDEGHSICEVFLTDVKVPKENLVGVEGKGWDYAKFLLGHERALIARVGRSKMQLVRAKNLINKSESEQLHPTDYQFTKFRLSALEARLRALEISEIRALETAEQNNGMDPATASMLKVEGSELCQALTEFLVDLHGGYAMAYEGRYTHPKVGDESVWGVLGDHLFNRVATIYGGSSEIQKNVIAKASL